MRWCKMKTDSVHISVIIPCYNGELFLPQLLHSLQSQTEPADEIIAIESFSKDRSLEILRAYSRSLPLRIEQRPRAGIYPAWNEGVGIASHSLCYIACVDDLVYPDAFYHLRRLYLAVPEVDLFTWRVDVIDDLANIVSKDGSPIVRSLWGDWAEKAHLRPGSCRFFDGSNARIALLIYDGSRIHQVVVGSDRWISY